MNKIKTKELQQALTNLFKLGVGKTNNNLTIVFGKTQTLLMVRRLDKFYQTNNNGFIEFAAVLDASNQEQGLVLLRDAVSFKKEINKIKSEDVEFELTGNELIINNGAYVTNYSSSDIRSRKTMNSQTMVTIDLDGKEFQQAYKQAFKHISLDKRRNWLNGIHHELKQGQLTIGATDAYTLSLETVPCSSNTDELDFFVTYDMAKTLSKLRAEKVDIYVEENDNDWYIRFILDGRYLLESTVKKGIKPHFERLIELKNGCNPVELDSTTLKEVVKYIKEKGYNNTEYQKAKHCHLVNFKVKDKKLEVFYQVKDNDEVKFVPLDVKLKYEINTQFDLNIYFNLDYLELYLTGQRGKVTLCFQNEYKRPNVRVFQVKLQGKDNFIGAIAPVRI
ncbi:hypothetical protein CP360_07710 [Lactobacillus sp. UMNPBX9]|nr:hypothetical protein CP360_07710 [Lactobacillus sp. UMNPBX9]